MRRIVILALACGLLGCTSMEEQRARDEQRRHLIQSIMELPPAQRDAILQRLMLEPVPGVGQVYTPSNTSTWR
jgi:hypothetical protein